VSDELLELPEGWAWVKTGDVCEGVVPGRTKPKSFSGTIPWITLPDITGMHISESQSNLAVTKEDAEEVGMRVMPKGTVLMSCVGQFGLICIAETEVVPNQQLHGFICLDKVLPDYVAYALMTEVEQMNQLASATTIAYINKTKCNSIQIPLAPTNEQKRIVAAIEALRERSQNARSALSAIPELCDKFRQSVLAAAFRGDLTADRREQNPDIEPASVLLERIREKREKISKSHAPKKNIPEELTDFASNGSLDLPKEWCLTTAIEACIEVVDCHNKTAPYTDSGIKLIRTSNIRNGVINLEDTKFVDQPTYEFWSRRCPPQPGDIIFTREAPMAEVGMIPPGQTICMGQRMMLLRADNEDLLAEYLVYVLQAPFIRRYAEEVAVGTGVKHLRVKDVEQLPIVIPPIYEQRLIVKIIKELFKAIALVEQQYHANNIYLAQLDCSILAKAFRGELVEQDPNDEPASVLLDRIRVDREQQMQGKIKKPGKKKRTGD